MTDNDFSKIIEQHRSPLYISVHATNPELHRKLIGYRHDFDFRKRLRFLSDNGIDLHTQIVVVPGLNDGVELERTLSDLSSLPGVLSVGIVPVGLTKFREHLPHLPAMTADCARECLNLAERFNQLRPTPWVFGADELYLKAGKEIPPCDFYGDFPQIENGIGMLRMTRENWQANREDFLSFLKGITTSLAMITGTSAAAEIRRIADDIVASRSGYSVSVFPITNHRMGESVTVTGLLCAEDILAQVDTSPDHIFAVSSSIFNTDSVTLDDMPRDELCRRLGGRLIVVDELFRDWELIEV